MADRYWVGGTGTWNASSTSVWSASSGGPSGASVPTASDSVFFNQAGTNTVTLSGTLACLDFNVSAGTLTFAGSGGLSISGNLTISGVVPTWTVTATTTFNATTAKTVTTNGMVFSASNVNFNGVGGSWTLQDALTLGSSGLSVILTAGTLDLNQKTLTAFGFSSSNTNVRTITMTNASVVLLTGSWAMGTSTNATVNAAGSTISMNHTSIKSFNVGGIAGGGLTFGTLNQGGVGDLRISGSNTFANITNTVQPATVRLTAGTTQTVNAFTLSGTPGNLITLDTSVAGTRATLSDASGTVSVSNVSIKDINATGGATWNAFTSNGNVDGGNNLGWNFGAAPVVIKTIFRSIFRPVFREIFRPIF